MKPILVTCYVNPDLDGVAGAIAYSEFLQKTGRNTAVCIIGTPHAEALYVLNRFHLARPKTIENGDEFDEIILVDASDLNGIEGALNPNKVIEIIDHRKIHEAEKFTNAKAQIELVGAAATLVAEKFIKNNTDISYESAVLLCSAIISNTLNFKAGVTTDRDIQAFKYLNKVAQLSGNFPRELFEAKSNLSGTELEKRIVGDLAFFSMGEKKISIAQIEIVDASRLVVERGEEIVRILRKIKDEMHFDSIFLNVIDLDEYKNSFVIDDVTTQILLEKVFTVKFNGIVAENTNQLLMRKQLVPLLKAELEQVN